MQEMPLLAIFFAFFICFILLPGVTLLFSLFFFFFHAPPAYARDDVDHRCDERLQA